MSDGDRAELADDSPHVPATESAVYPRPTPVEFPHFPTPQQAVVWRNWQLVPVDRLARVLDTSRENVLALAKGMALRVPPVVGERWLERGYVTLIRGNWHLLPNSQLLQLLEWTAAKLEYTLKEDDFLWDKLGCLQPRVDPVRYSPLTAEQQSRTAEMAAILEKHFPDRNSSPVEAPFAFLAEFNSPPAARPAPQQDSQFDLRLVYSYSAVYGDPLSDPRLDPYPDGLLGRLAESGINGIWLQGVLYRLARWEAFGELSVGYERRIENLRRLTERAGKFGMGVYLYLNEPRAMPVKFFDRCPQWKGVEVPEWGVAAFCTSQEPILEYLRDATAQVLRGAPDLAGVITITMSENLTNCFSRGGQAGCPRCRDRAGQEVIAEVNGAIEAGVHGVNREARVIVWTWGWDPQWAHAAVDLLADNVELMCTSEEAVPTNVGGTPGAVLDYSISQVGPGERALGMWRRAIDRGLKAVAKVQLNNTWECSAVPYLPTPDLVEQHLAALRAAGVTGLMASWTVGGYPGGNLRLLARSADELAVEDFGAAAGAVQRACRRFSEAFKEFPFHIDVLYMAPQNYGPANLLHAKPTGYAASMMAYPYDDLDGWRAIYPADVFEEQFKKLSVGWKEGMELLDRVERAMAEEHRQAFSELRRIALAVYCHFRSTYLQIAFVRLRQVESADAAERILAILEEEIELAKTLHGLVREDSRIGFEATNHYYYTENDLREKVINCERLRGLYQDAR